MAPACPLPPFESADAEVEARLQGLTSSLRSADPTGALQQLAELIDAAEGEWASALGSYVRSAGIVADLVELVGHDDAEVCTRAIHVEFCEQPLQFLRTQSDADRCHGPR